MRLFVEGATYKGAYLKDCFGELFTQISRRNSQGEGYMLDAVGYYFNRSHHQLYFILPKVFAKASGSGQVVAFDDIVVDAQCSIDVSVRSISKQLKSNGWKENIIYELPIWLYQAISKYRKTDRHKRIEQEEALQDLLTPQMDDGETTILDIVLALKNFHRQHKDLFVLTPKQTNNGYNKVHWRKTIKRNMPLYIQIKFISLHSLTTSRCGIRQICHWS